MAVLEGGPKSRLSRKKIKSFPHCCEGLFRAFVRLFPGFPPALVAFPERLSPFWTLSMLSRTVCGTRRSGTGRSSVGVVPHAVGRVPRPCAGSHRAVGRVPFAGAFLPLRGLPRRPSVPLRRARSGRFATAAHSNARVSHSEACPCGPCHSAPRHCACAQRPACDCEGCHCDPSL